MTVALFLFAVAICAGYPVKLQLLQEGERGDFLPPGSAPPDFELVSVDGQRARLSTTLEAHQVVVLTFWATWCHPCVSELRALAKTYPEPGKHRLAVIAVNVGESLESVRSFQSREGLPFDLLLDPNGEIARRYGVKAFPTTLLIVGRLVSRTQVGADPYLASDIRRALGSPR